MAAKKTLIVIGAAALITYILMKGNKAFAALTSSQTIRGCDPLGCGEFGAPRGARKHNGIDIVATPGQTIFSPISGKVNRMAYPYADDLSYKGLEIQNDQYKVKIFYINPTIAIGSQVKAGDKIAVAQNISAKHGAAMTNHVHFEVYDRTGKLIDPTKMI